MSKGFEDVIEAQRRSFLKIMQIIEALIQGLDELVVKCEKLESRINILLEKVNKNE